jgi:hypothetical protein
MAKYTLENLKKIINNPKKFTDALRYIVWDIKNPIHNSIEKYRYSYYDEVTDIIDKDWDNLILIDACRHDILQEVCGEQIPYQFSVASNSPDFIEKTMNGKELYDTVYISSNPFTHSVLDENIFYDVIQTYHEGFDATGAEGDYTDYHPENVYDICKEKIPKYDNKRFIVHFMQPHGPYFGTKAEQLRQNIYEAHNVGFERLPNQTSDADITYSDLMYAALHGYVTTEEVREIYIENLELVLEYVYDLNDKLAGKTIISSDHGEMLGNPSSKFSRRFGHITGSYTPELRKVPWLELGYGQRKETIREEPVQYERATEAKVEEQLKELGYL